ncbi:hypothetical protein DPMN_065791 [Dreissena polymorpha]|uniref:Uncharacterized protein n=1 Tax=Dreissena polymorpha TaxID=45954 RepID=A0A9D3YWL5_DREPO|nr:hypothetical protein DPMN_065791 [Dreissena polymorpha]
MILLLLYTRGNGILGKCAILTAEKLRLTLCKRRNSRFSGRARKTSYGLSKKDILCTMPPPVPTGRSNRMFKFDDDALQSVEQNFQAHMQNC